MPIKNYTTKVPAVQTVGEIQGILAAHGARVTLQTRDFSDHVEYFSYEFGRCLGIVPTTLAPRVGIDTREEYRAFTLADLPLRTSFFAVFKESFVATENGALLYEEMRRAAL